MTCLYGGFKATVNAIGPYPNHVVCSQTPTKNVLISIQNHKIWRCVNRYSSTNTIGHDTKIHASIISAHFINNIISYFWLADLLLPLSNLLYLWASFLAVSEWHQIDVEKKWCVDRLELQCNRMCWHIQSKGQLHSRWINNHSMKMYTSQMRATKMQCIEIRIRWKYQMHTHIICPPAIWCRSLRNYHSLVVRMFSEFEKRHIF